jgi:uncharacterized protein
LSEHLTLRYARSPWSRAWGLLGRTTYDPGTALVIENCFAVHTWFMRMPIDVVFVDECWRVIAVHASVGAWRVVREPAAFAVLELAGGEALRTGLVSGTALRQAQGDR